MMYRRCKFSDSHSSQQLVHQLPEKDLEADAPDEDSGQFSACTTRSLISQRRESVWMGSHPRLVQGGGGGGGGGRFTIGTLEDGRLRSPPVSEPKSSPLSPADPTVRIDGLSLGDASLSIQWSDWTGGNTAESEG